eukprot:1192091-Rhodomonas_salina.2
MGSSLPVYAQFPTVAPSQYRTTRRTLCLYRTARSTIGATWSGCRGRVETKTNFSAKGDVPSATET